MPRVSLTLPKTCCNSLSFFWRGSREQRGARIRGAKNSLRHCRVSEGRAALVGQLPRGAPLRANPASLSDCAVGTRSSSDPVAAGRRGRQQ